MVATKFNCDVMSNIHVNPLTPITRYFKELNLYVSSWNARLSITPKKTLFLDHARCLLLQERRQHKVSKPEYRISRQYTITVLFFLAVGMCFKKSRHKFIFSVLFIFTFLESLNLCDVKHTEVRGTRLQLWIR